MTAMEPQQAALPGKTLAVIAIEGFDLSIYALFALSIAHNLFTEGQAATRTE